jgi:raffinose/stachyose/melibiose transport system permease protein
MNEPNATAGAGSAWGADAEDRPRARRVGGWQRGLSPYLFLAPALLWYLVFLIYPMASSLVLSFYEWDGLSPEWTFVGLANYETILLRDHVSRRALVNNIIWMLVTLTVPTVLGLLLAVALDQALPGRRLFRSIFYGTGVMPLVAVGIIWAWMYNPQFGLINAVLQQVGLGGLARGWLSDYTTALPATLVTAIWQGTGFPMILYLAGLQGIPHEQYDAARIDGANGVQCFRYVTLPWLRETHVIVITLAIINSFKVFDLIYTMTYGGPGRSTQVLATWMYFNTFQYYNAGLGSAIAWVIVLLSMCFAIPYLRINSRQ